MKINKTKLIAYCGMVALLASMIVGLLGFSNSTKNINDIKNQLLKKHVENNINLTMKYINNSYGTLTQGDGTLLDSDGNSIEGRFGVVDTVLEDLGDKSTIFVKVKDDFKRISTNIMSDENERAIGTFLGTDHNAYQTVINGELYIGEAEILGESYYTAYQPIKDKNNNVIGLLFVGMPTKILDNIIKLHDAKMSKINILIIVLRAISLGSLIALVSASVVGMKFNSNKTDTSNELPDICE
ncbi:Cache 3/Cache 2 fusion domain-containing protein [Tissierella praeacuta]|uniref:Cache 3/Cache 2 fusion domain-containing protein n=1 Tax=Tissierella praeacuta TaxID=43131 RepID=UPI0028AD14D8|nr:Cache 3/Cache 2 fusion domain-containing protein [Tissierella praeacuta]